GRLNFVSPQYQIDSIKGECSSLPCKLLPVKGTCHRLAPLRVPVKLTIAYDCGPFSAVFTTRGGSGSTRVRPLVKGREAIAGNERSGPRATERRGRDRPYRQRL